MVKVEVRSVMHREGNKNGKAWAMDIAKVIVQNADGSEAMGQVILPKGHPEVKAGHYEAELKAIDQQGDVVFVVARLVVAKSAALPKVA